MLEKHQPRLEVARFPRNAICAVTTSWDDNEAATLEILEVLNSTNLKGTFYIDPGNTRGQGLTDSQLKSMAATNEVGSHTWSHIDLKECDAETAREELTHSKHYIERVTGHTVLGIAYPWGKYSPAVETMVRECGYMFARTVDEGNVGFPPSNLYAWGISVHALRKPRLLSKKAPIYVRTLTRDWPGLALKLFEKARRTSGVWHLFGHGTELLQQPGLKDQLLEICRHVAGRNDVWYTTNSMLFINEIIKNSVRITPSCHDRSYTFRVRVSPFPRPLSWKPRVPLRLTPPRDWGDRYDVEIATSSPEGFEMGKTVGHVWIDIGQDGATVEVIRQ
jgi:peptidoglycan/xylan/chitin deacetylase (PgdA/CDA1 family)